jgi:RNA polymerase sigma factor (sigma-70 family)
MNLLVTDESLARMLERSEPGLKEFVGPKVPLRLRSTVSIDDILQEVWMEAFRELPGTILTGEDSLLRWLITVAKRKLVNAIKAHQTLKRGGNLNRQCADRATSIIDLFHCIASAERTPSSVAALSEAAIALRRALTDLPPANRRAISLKYIEGHPVESIGRIMDKTTDAVRALIFRGLRQLEDQLGSSASFFSQDALVRKSQTAQMAN